MKKKEKWCGKVLWSKQGEIQQLIDSEDPGQSELAESFLAVVDYLLDEGPMATRPLVGTIRTSKYSNMREMIVQHKGDPYRFFFIFTEDRNALVLCYDTKKGYKNDDVFYKKMVPKAEKIFQSLT